MICIHIMNMNKQTKYNIINLAKLETKKIHKYYDSVNIKKNYSTQNVNIIQLASVNLYFIKKIANVL
jgi:hypothetical protein